MTTVACRACGLPNPLGKHVCGDCERAGRRGRVTASPFNSATPRRFLGRARDERVGMLSVCRCHPHGTLAVASPEPVAP